MIKDEVVKEEGRRKDEGDKDEGEKDESRTKGLKDEIARRPLMRLAFLRLSSFVPAFVLGLSSFVLPFVLRPSAFILPSSLITSSFITFWGVSTACAATRYDPSLRFRVRTTAHFVIYYHAGEEELARRLAALVEPVHAELTARLRATPWGRTHVILVDQTDRPGGWASPLPYNTIEMSAAWPTAGETIGNTDDWLRLVFAHEYAHILHLDRSKGWAAGLRRLFGRTPIAFPNLFLPIWQIEGLATWVESAETGRGRLPAGDFRAIVDQAARAGRFEPLDRVNGGLVDWPGGTAPYAYGGYFHQYLSDRFGAEKLAELAERTAGRVPYTASRAFEKVFGHSLGELWRAFESACGPRGARTREACASGGGAPRALRNTVRDPGSRPSHEASAGRRSLGGGGGIRGLEPEIGGSRSPHDAPRAGSATPRRLTDHGFVVAGPRFLLGHLTRSDAGALPRIVYSARDPHDFPSLRMIGPGGGRSERLATRTSGSQIGIGERTIYFDQIEVERNVGLSSDLYELELASRRVRRLTRAARLSDPDLSPDGRLLACVRHEPGRRALALLTIDSRALSVLVSEPETQFASPRWSPDGRLVAVERQRLYGPSEIVLIEVATRAVRVLISSPDARNAHPSWAPDGLTLLFASDRDQGPFNLYAADLRDQDARLYQITELASGATFPTVSPDGGSIVFVGYTADGYDLFTIPFDRATWQPTSLPALPQRLDAGGPAGLKVCAPADHRHDTGCDGPAGLKGCAPADHRPDTGGARLQPCLVSAGQTGPGDASYFPWKTLLPRFWMPTVELDDEQVKAGGATAGVDVLGRHGYAAEISWRVNRGSPESSGGRARPDWGLFYAYDRWRPTVLLAAEDRTQPVGVRDRSGALRRGELRERHGSLGVYLPHRRVRFTQAWFGAINHERDSVMTPERAESLDRHALRLGWSFNNAKTYGFSISREEGVTAAVTSEHVRRALGADGNADAATIDARGYLRLGPRHAVLAVRGAAGAGWGDAPVRRLFDLGSRGPSRAAFDYGRDALGLMRGFGSRAFTGDRIALLNIDYRFPLARVERGRGTWPLFLRIAHAAVFLDAGHAWTGRFASRELKTAVGAELAFDAVGGYAWPFTAVAGVAWGRDAATSTDRASVYVRLGRAF